jgi:(2Fe-2S) ferredoxin
MSDTKLVYVCEGGDCSERGSVELFEKLRNIFHERDPHEEKVRIRKYPCFGGCDFGVNVTIWPDRIFYSEVKETDLPEIADQVLEGAPELERLKGKVKPDVEEILWQMLDSPY